MMMSGSSKWGKKRKKWKKKKKKVKKKKTKNKKSKEKKHKKVNGKKIKKNKKKYSKVCRLLALVLFLFLCDFSNTNKKMCLHFFQSTLTDQRR